MKKMCDEAPYIIVQLIEAEWRIYLSVNEVNIGSDNGLSSLRHRAITWTNDHPLLIGTLKKKEAVKLELNTAMCTLENDYAYGHLLIDGHLVSARVLCDKLN